MKAKEKITIERARHRNKIKVWILSLEVGEYLDTIKGRQRMKEDIDLITRTFTYWGIKVVLKRGITKWQ
jgi:hypothetical protein